MRTALRTTTGNRRAYNVAPSCPTIGDPASYTRTYTLSLCGSDPGTDLQSCAQELTTPFPPSPYRSTSATAALPLLLLAFSRLAAHANQVILTPYDVWIMAPYDDWRRWRYGEGG